ncbi:hypothetical protein CV102_01020 [Natronococcus pandeyae]|uniref:Uncharacterized protein n=1 Tax=Natronococcus pandeyae TaxID=2055836 RepID=A0A8J8TTR8_9EURY|nr:hypothetical protein CV102_01020 [Natronococcus pandeyae]
MADPEDGKVDLHSLSSHPVGGRRAFARLVPLFRTEELRLTPVQRTLLRWRALSAGRTPVRTVNNSVRGTNERSAARSAADRRTASGREPVSE